MNYIDAEFELTQTFKDSLHTLTPNFGFGAFGEIVYYRSYSRTVLGKEIRQEGWADTVIRVIQGVMSIRKDHYLKNRIEWDEKHWQSFAQDMSRSMFRMNWLPPGRGLWAMGTDLVRERGSMALYNCSVTLIGSDWIEDLCWMMDCLAHGVGVGFRVVRTGITLTEPAYDYDYVIPDSREGWVESIRLLLKAYEGKGKPIFDYTEIRPEGSLIKTFGGIASGPGPLKDLHLKMDELCHRYSQNDESDTLYDEIEFKTDLANLIGVCIVTGNVRRSAELALCDFDEDIFWDLKNPKKKPERRAWSYMSNNSVALSEDNHFENIDRIAQANINGYDIGYVNMRNINKGRIGKQDNEKEDDVVCTNPCQPSWAWVLTPDGLRQFKDIDVGSTIWSECGWTTVVKKVSTGVNKIYRYHTTAGTFYGTENHELVSEGWKFEAKHCVDVDVLVGPVEYDLPWNPQTVMDGLVFGDGSFAGDTRYTITIGNDDQDYFKSEIKEYIGDHYNKPDKEHKAKTTLRRGELSRPENKVIPDRYVYGDVRSFLRGLYTANGSIVSNRVTFKTTSIKLVEQVQMMLSSIGIYSYYTTNKPTVVKHHNGVYESLQSYDINITGTKMFAEQIGFLQKYKQQKLNEINSTQRRYKQTYDIIQVDFVSEEETFDITVSNMQHTYWTQGLNVSNCGEIGLQHREVCNVADTVPTRCVDSEQWLEACKYATFYCSTVSLLPTHQPSTNRVVTKNRRIGIGIMDVTGWIHQNGVSKVTRFLRDGYHAIRDYNRHLAEEAGVPESIRVTTIKPNGSTSKLVGRTPGVGYPTFRYTLRRIRIQANTRLEQLLREANIPNEPDKYSKNTVVFEYPILQGPAQPATEVSLYEQAMNVVLLQREYVDNAVSNTLYFKPRWIRISKCAWQQEEHVPKLRFQLIDGTDFTIPLHKIRELEDDEHIEIKIHKDRYRFEKATPIENSTLYQYNPHHEEDQIESVLAAIAPLTKSVSLLPHTEQGIFEQSPEEGITKDEYEERLAAIKPINWSLFVGSDGIDQKFCDGDKCVIQQ